ncbi:hypothetical protein F441_22735 [Phytophthora nicotianae CJ01A1]|uniref:Uncharacterized protein n=2 Tax=Phytophthora nicotianae TaxID=4792 RepID=W2VNT5_PHYNI|nr:hypothetical protein L916_08987 [Phytophthora nicotianae]ETO99840.1 hypothetical protein F441_22735 [Phytophthora nicotianae CJ01A1]
MGQPEGDKPVQLDALDRHSKDTRRFTNLSPICVETLYGDMETVVKAVKKSIGEEMLKSFDLVIDDWTHGTEHF